MLCDRCLLLIGNSLPEKTRKTLYRLHNLGETTIKALSQSMGLSVHESRKALIFLKGATLVWGNWSAYSISPAGERLIGLLAAADRPAPARLICDDCLMELGEALPPRESDVLACFSTRPLTNLDIVVSTGLSRHKVQESLLLLQGAQLVEARSKGRIFYLTHNARRLDILLRQQPTAGRDMIPATV